jgi:Na+/proline symporter
MQDLTQIITVFKSIPKHHRFISATIVTFFAYLVASNASNTITELVAYAWSGLGASFGPVILYSIYGKNVRAIEAVVGILVGSLTVILWNYAQQYGLIRADIYAILPGWTMSCLAIFISKITKSV